ncbi:BadM/Rrf2 family transcriptional regulator [Massilia sp. Root133]|uniref:Rrf2 family transcriptional regulator n=1 Tax=Massilia cellulosiltytica TaxID=2683234 RepID=A0A7X3G7J4_9BURK|nr:MULTISPECIES: Rrf2 family transcriptional regulator [Telluria group]KQY16928.1 BadM/Rrf2 family transcriptional regulator [Massilia sp. Root133]KQZ46150.1 BadM/Rrf2 family transcriptional regulator [Massilia sp. Root1485]MVW64349.1 Rrf2 family transcriptional regulator [Telluria cellulosilytica]
MRLTRFSDIGLRVLIYLERAGERLHPVTVAEIGKQFNIPLNHLVKVVGQLAKLGWVQATRGRNGGLRLAADPATLTIGQVLRKLEGEDDELVDCDGTDCALKMDCQLRGMLRAGMRAFYDAMDRYTLAHATAGNTGEQVVRMHRMFLDGAAAKTAVALPEPVSED